MSPQYLTRRMSIKTIQVAQSRLNTVDFNNLPFGKIFSDHMLVADYIDGVWQAPQIIPFGDIPLSPSLSALHHAQAIFEGMKAFKNNAGEVIFFRMEDNFNRMNISAERMCMPLIPREIFVDGIMQLVELDKSWIPTGEGQALYIRPVMFSSDTAIGVKPSENYKLIIITMPTGAYYLEPLKVWVETKYSRSAYGGTGYAKAAGNYGGAMYPSKLAAQNGYHQLLWTDAVNNEVIEESGSMNVMFMFDDVLVTPALNTSMLAGITRDSILRIARDWGVKVEEREVTVTELIEKYKAGKIKEAFGVGTAANIAHIATIGHTDVIMELPDIATRTFSNKMYEHLFAYKRGEREDKFGWLTKI